MPPPQVSIRPAVQADLPAILAIYNDAILTTTATFDTREKTVQDMQEWMYGHNARHPVIVAGTADGIAGWACLSAWSDRCAYEATAENSIYVAAAHRGQGTGGALLARLIEHAQKQHMHTIIARIAAGNPASEALHERAGFKRIGTMREVGRKFGKLIDVHMYQLMLKP